MPIALTIAEVNKVTSSTDGAAMVVGGVGVVPELLPLPVAMMGILGAFCMGQEYRFNTLQPTMLAIPKRTIIVLAKAVVCAGVGAGTALISMMLNTLMVFLIIGRPVPLHDQQGTLIGFTFLMAGWAMLGLGLSLCFRQTLAAVIFMFAVPLVVETIIRLMVGQISALAEYKQLVQYLPFAAGNAMANAVGAQRLDFGAPLSRAEYAALFFGFVLLILGTGYHRFVNQDA